MSIGFAGLHMLLPALGELQRSAQTRILLLGTQDLAFTYDEAVDFFRSQNVAFVEVPVAEQRTTNSFAHVPHQDWWQFRDFIHQETLFRMLGFGPSQVSTLDVDDYEHADILQDLNYPLARDFGQFDLVLNQGTLEHVFDIRQALWNLSDLTADNGQIVHMVPTSFLNHGFYNFNALIFSDFYGQAGWAQQELYYSVLPRTPTGGRDLYARVHPDKLTTMPCGFYMNVFGRFRKTPGASRPVAVQGLYLGLHEAWNHQSRAQSTHEAPAGGFPRKTTIQRAREWITAVVMCRRLAKLGGETISVPRPDDTRPRG